MKKNALLSIAVAGSLLIGSQAFATPFTKIRIGDQDGFGYDADANFINLKGDALATAVPGPADINGDGVLRAGDVLPSLNNNSIVATGNNDDFDNRLAESVNGSGFTDTGSTGTLFTDISLSTSYQSSKNANQVYNANTSTFGAGGAFPDANPAILPNQPGFVFKFVVAGTDIVAGTNIYFNMVFGDYDVTPASINFNFASSSTTLAVSPHNTTPTPLDGLIQSAFAVLNFYDVFTASGSNWNGLVGVNFNAPNEPYTAFDFVELALAPIQPPSVPEPGTLLLLTGGLLGLTNLRKRRKA